MRRTYDIIIIGAGISGLGLGALLAREGRKVLLLEKNPVIGGRAYSFSHRGHILNIGGPRAGLLDGIVDRLFSRLEKRPGDRGLFEGMATYRDGVMVNFASLVSPQHMLELFQAAKQVSPEDLEKYDNLPASEWLDTLEIDHEAREVARYTGIVMTTIPRLEEIAASSLIGSILHGIKHYITYLPHHGYGDYMRILAEAFTERGGEILTRARAREIMVTGNRVRGVRGEEREKEGNKRERKIESPVVVTAFPVWEVFKLIGESLFPAEFVSKVKHLNRPATIFGITAAMREPLYQDKLFILADLPKIRHPFSAFIPTNIAPSLSPEGEYLFECCCQCDPALGADKSKLRKHIELLKEDLEDIYPGWGKKCIWSWSYFHWVESARTPGRDGVFRPGLQAPGIDGLYFIGDSTDSRYAPGLECAADSAMRAEEMIRKA